MRLLAFDPFHGAAGDMICGSLISLGAPAEPVMRAMGSVVHTPQAEPVSRCGISALKIHTMASPSRRTLDEVLGIVRTAEAPAAVIQQAEQIFFRIAHAEEKVHGSRHVHFHEVGADDAIADVIGSCMALHLISPDRVVCLPIAMGHGTISCAHGTVPVPAPATAEIIASSDLLVMTGDHAGEQLTPTGAAILAEIADQAAPSLPYAKIVSVGYGAGSRDDPRSPNVLRALLMEGSGLMTDTMDILETNVDDCSGELVGTLLEMMLENGARDAAAVPILMKKGRPGHLIRVIAPPGRSEELAEMMARQLGTLGIRITPAVHRFIAERVIRNVQVTINNTTTGFPVKFGYIGGSCYLVKPEYEFARAYADEHHIPVRDVLHLVEEAGRAWLRNGGA